MPSLRLILSAINTSTYKLRKILVPILKVLISNEYTVKDSFVFAEEIIEQDSEFFVGSMDFDCLFTNIPFGVYMHFNSFYDLRICLALFTQLLIDAFGYAQIELNHTLN